MTASPIPRRSACSCLLCRSACLTVPGWFGSMREVRRVARWFGMTVDAFVRTHCVIDWWDGASVVGLTNPPMAIGIARQDDVDEGRMEADGPGNYRCSMLGPDGCRMPLGVRPIECAAYDHSSRALRQPLSERWARENQDRLDAWRKSTRTVAPPLAKGATSN